jgi:hypothetical protein
MGCGSDSPCAGMGSATSFGGPIPGDAAAGDSAAPSLVRSSEDRPGSFSSAGSRLLDATCIGELTGLLDATAGSAASGAVDTLRRDTELAAAALVMGLKVLPGVTAAAVTASAAVGSASIGDAKPARCPLDRRFAWLWRSSTSMRGVRDGSRRLWDRCGITPPSD